MYQRILVPIDGSDASRHALREALALAAEQQGRVCVLVVVESALINLGLELAFDTRGILRALRRSAHDVVREAEFMAQEAGVAAEPETVEITTFGKRVADAICEQAETWGADLVVLAAAPGEAEHRTLGRVAAGVVRGCPVSVLLVPAPVPLSSKA